MLQKIKRALCPSDCISHILVASVFVLVTALIVLLMARVRSWGEVCECQPSWLLKWVPTGRC